MLSQKKAVMVTDRGGEGSFSLILAGTHPSSSNTRSSCRVTFPIHNGAQDHAGGLAHDIGDDITQREIRSLQRFLKAIDLSGSFFGQTNPRASHVTERSLRSRRENARFEPSMLQQISNPLGIVGIGFPAWDGFAMLSVDHEHLHLAFKHVLHWFPVHSRTFSGHMSTFVFQQPIEKVQHILSRWTGRAKRFACLSMLLPKQYTDASRFLLPIKTGTSGRENIHLTSPGSSDLPSRRMF
jgi:hypothetical protein